MICSGHRGDLTVRGGQLADVWLEWDREAGAPTGPHRRGWCFRELPATCWGGRSGLEHWKANWVPALLQEWGQDAKTLQGVPQGRG